MNLTVRLLVLWALAMPAFAQSPFTDIFDVAGDTNIGTYNANYAAIGGQHVVESSNDTLRVNATATATYSVLNLVGEGFTSTVEDCRAEIDVVSFAQTTSGNYVGVGCRANSDGSAWYECRVYGDGTWEMIRTAVVIDTGSYTIGTLPGQVQLDIVGDQLTCSWRDSALDAATTDATIASGDYAWIIMRNTSSITGFADNLVVTDLGGGTPAAAVLTIQKPSKGYGPHRSQQLGGLLQ